MAHTENNPIHEKSPYDGSIRISQGQSEALPPVGLIKALAGIARSLEKIRPWIDHVLAEEYIRLKEKSKEESENLSYLEDAQRAMVKKFQADKAVGKVLDIPSWLYANKYPICIRTFYTIRKKIKG